jgi:ABC-type transport system involved in cytochrome c biogenesis permease subunit
MQPSRLRSGEIVAGLGALLLLVVLFAHWFDGRSGWGSLGWLALVPLVVAIAGGLGLVLTTLTERTPAKPVAVGVLTVPWALLAVLVILVRLIAQPGDDAAVSVGLPAYLGLLGAVAILAGAWRAIGDERTDSPHARAQTERALSVRGEPRPVPPPRDEPPPPP